jgi:hypothetical protein
MSKRKPSKKPSGKTRSCLALNQARAWSDCAYLVLVFFFDASRALFQFDSHIDDVGCTSWHRAQILAMSSELFAYGQMGWRGT